MSTTAASGWKNFVSPSILSSDSVASRNKGETEVKTQSQICKEKELPKEGESIVLFCIKLGESEAHSTHPQKTKSCSELGAEEKKK